MGDQTTASGLRSFTMGLRTVASKDQATAMGVDTTASGYASSAMGHYTIAQGFSQTVIGQYDVARGNSGAWIAADTEPVFIVGNGTGEQNRSNALVVNKDGSVLMKPQGDLPMGDFQSGQQP
jgi:hypothetical protein